MVRRRILSQWASSSFANLGQWGRRRTWNCSLRPPEREREGKNWRKKGPLQEWRRLEYKKREQKKSPHFFSFVQSSRHQKGGGWENACRVSLDPPAPTDISWALCRKIFLDLVQKKCLPMPSAVCSKLFVARSAGQNCASGHGHRFFSFFLTSLSSSDLDNDGV